MPPKISQTIEKGTGECPDCGQTANIKVIYTHDYDGNKTAGYHLVIDCPHCDYYEFTYHGPDN